MSDNEVLHISDVARAIRRHWVSALVAFLLITGAGLLAAQTQPERFRASATVVATPDLSAEVDSPVEADQLSEAVISALAVEMASRTFEDAAESRLRGGVAGSSADVSVTADSDLRLITIDATSGSAETAATWANAWAEEAALRPERSPLVTVRVLDPAVAPVSPYSPVQTVMLIGSLVLGMIGAASAALFAQKRRRRIGRAVPALRALAVPFIQRVPPLSTFERTPDLSADLSPSAEDDVEALAAHVRLVSAGPSAVGIVTDRDGTPVVHLVARLGKALTSDRDVTIIDADLREPALHLPWQGEPSPGVGDLDTLPRMNGRLPAALAIPIHPRMTAIPAGRTARHPAAVLATHLPGLLRSLVETGHTALASCPSLRRAETAAIAQSVDGVLLVLRSTVTAEEAEEAVTELRGVGAVVLGVILAGPRHRAGSTGWATRTLAATTGGTRKRPILHPSEPAPVDSIEPVAARPESPTS